MPYARRDGRLLVVTADPGPDTVLFARQQWGAQIDFAVASKFDITWAVQSSFQAELSERAISVLSARDPVMSARYVANLPQAIICYGVLTAFLLGFALAPISTLIALNVLMGLFYLGNFLLKGILVSVGGGRSVEADDAIAVAVVDLAVLDPRALANLQGDALAGVADAVDAAVDDRHIHAVVAQCAYKRHAVV